MADKILKVHHVGDYARYLRAEELHPLVSVIHYDEIGLMHHSLNRYDVYGMFIADEQLEQLTYGMMQYTLDRHALMCVSPGEIGGKTDTGEEIQTHGWALLFDPELLHGTELQKRMASYTYFNYNTSEALLMSDSEHTIITGLMAQIREALRMRLDETATRRIVVSLLSAILEYCASFYARQLSTPTQESDNLLLRFEKLLQSYFDKGMQRRLGLPSVKYCAQELFLSPNYFGDLIRERTGLSATLTIRRFVIARAKSLLRSGSTITETADMLGFEYPQHFTRLFKQETGLTPSAYQKQA